MRKITGFAKTFEGMIFSDSFQEGCIALEGGVAKLDFAVDFDGVVKDGDIIVLQDTDNNNVTTDVIEITLTEVEESLDYQVKILGRDFDYVQFDYALGDSDCLIGFFAKNYGLTISNGEKFVYSPFLDLPESMIGVRNHSEGIINRIEMKSFFSLIFFEDTLVLNGDFYTSYNRDLVDIATKKILAEDILNLQMETFGDLGLLNIKTTTEDIVIQLSLSEVDVEKIENFLKEVKGQL